MLSGDTLLRIGPAEADSIPCERRACCIVRSLAHRLLAPRNVFLVGTRDHEYIFNLIPVSNVTSASTEPQHIAVAVYKDWRTFQNLMISPGFAISVPEIGQLEAVWKLGAKYSKFPAGSNQEKLDSSGIELDYDKSRYGPVTPSGIGWASCRIIARIDLSGNHGIFVGEVEEAWFNPRFLHPDGTPSGPAKPVMQQTGNLFATVADNLLTVPYFDNQKTGSGDTST